MADKDNNRLIYVEITFCDYFSDINYEEIIVIKNIFLKVSMQN